MADDASITLSATILPDEISKTISGSMTVSPDDANDKWYYKLTAITTTSADLIAGRFIDYTAVYLLRTQAQRTELLFAWTVE